MTNNIKTYDSNTYKTTSLVVISKSVDEKSQPEKDICFFLMLNQRVKSEEAEHLVNLLISDATSAHTKSVKRSAKFTAALGAIIADLMRRAANDKDGFCYRPFKPESFTDGPVGYRNFIKAYSYLLQRGYIDVRAGYRTRDRGAWGGVATRLRASPFLIALAEGFGIEAADWRSHFETLPRPKLSRSPIVLRRMRYVNDIGGKVGGDAMPVPKNDPHVIKLGKQVNKLNEFFTGVAIADSETSVDHHYLFRRIFNNGDSASFDWNKGGRLYSNGGYQNIARYLRSSITLNGESTVELDVSGSFLTILHGMLGVSMPNRDDIYQIDDIPRHITKAIINNAFGLGKWPSRWTRDCVDKFTGEARNLGKLFPIANSIENILSNFPVLRAWEGSGIDWADLQYRESEAIIGAISELAFEHRVPALPVHDSIIVPASKEALARRALSDAYYREVGVKPRIKRK